MNDEEQFPLPQRGQHVRVTDGPFAGFAGIVVALDEMRRRVQVIVAFFGRTTILDLDVLQVVAR